MPMPRSRKSASGPEKTIAEKEIVITRASGPITAMPSMRLSALPNAGTRSAAACASAIG
jgi:hypothetical protein